MSEQAIEGAHFPVSRAESAWATLRYAGVTVAMLGRRRLRLVPGRVGQRFSFADGTTGRVFRETVTDLRPGAPCVLVVRFRLRWVRGRGHWLFERESLLNTVLFAGYPGLVSKLWLAADEHGRYRGYYEWDGPERAEHYARCLWRVLALVSVPGSVDYHLIAGTTRDQSLNGLSAVAGSVPGDPNRWWEPVAVSAPPRTITWP